MKKGQPNIFNGDHKVNPFCQGAVRFSVKAVYTYLRQAQSMGIEKQIIQQKGSHSFPKTTELQTSLWKIQKLFNDDAAK